MLLASLALPAAAENLNGIWQALGTAHHNVEPHAASTSPIVAAGAFGAAPAVPP